jgi:hypothetical protein
MYRFSITCDEDTQPLPPFHQEPKGKLLTHVLRPPPNAPTPLKTTKAVTPEFMVVVVVVD